MPGEFRLSAGAHFGEQDLAESLHPDDAARVLAAIRDTIVNDAPYDIEYRILTPAGEQRWIHARGAVQRRADGTPLEMSGFTSNITARNSPRSIARCWRAS